MSAIFRKLQGGNLEVFKVSPTPLNTHTPPSLSSNSLFNPIGPFLTQFQFGMYIMFPIGWMYYFGTNLEERFTVSGFWPTPEQSHKIPTDKEDIDRELARMRMVDGLRRERRERERETAEALARVKAESRQ